MGRENQRITITKRLLKESMLRLLREKELDKINVTELCRDAGINRATFYRHYEIPRDVLIEIEKDLYYDLKRVVSVPKTAEDVRPCIDKMCAYMEQNANLLKIIIQCNSDTDFAMFINEIYLELWSEIGRLPVFRDLDPEDVKLITLYSAGGSYFILRHWLLGNLRMSAEQMSSYIYELLNKTDLTSLSAQLGLNPGRNGLE